MNTPVENTDQKLFANGELRGDLRVRADYWDSHEVDLDPLPARGDLEVEVDLNNPRLDADSADSRDRLEALRSDSVNDRDWRVELTSGSENENSGSGGGPWYRRISRRVLLIGLLAIAAAAAAPSVWSYLQSYESTDDAQIDGHIDPLSSRVDGTVVGVHVEDDDRVKQGQLIVEIDPRDYQVAVERAKAQWELADAQVASAKQDYAAALANVRESQADNFRAQRDAQRYAILLNKQVVAQEQYDQYTAIAGVDAAKVDSAREAAGSVFKSIAAREADADAAKAAFDEALLNLSYTKIYAPANGIVGKRGVQLGSRIQPGQTLMFVTETDNIWVTADFKETQLARMHRGEKVTIHVDTFGRDYRGYVKNMPGASGDRFSLLPSENATGNYVKVVQRLPVRILLEPGQDPEHRLHPGMSVEPSVWLR
jgi:membrane fusion protein, multidrug efflux system